MKEEEIRRRETFNTYLRIVEEDIKTIFKDRSIFIHIACPACGRLDYWPQFEKFGFNYVLCQRCKTLFVNPRPSLELLIEFYKNSKSTVFWIEKFFKPVADVRREKMFRPRAEFVKDTMPKFNNSVIGDIGAGFGLFLEELAVFWPSAKMVAIEPSLDMAEICRKKGFTVIASAIEDVQGWDDKFDLITNFELFEHLFSPEEFLQKIRDLLKAGGYLYLTTLNGMGFDILLLWEKSKSIAPPQHLNFFNPSSMELLLKKSGFEIIEISTPGVLDWDIVEGMIKNEAIDLGRFYNYLANEGSDNCKKELQEWITKNGLSSHMRILARKKV